MSAPYVFCGPSLPPALAGELYPEAVVRGPVECGDVYTAAKSRPSAIAIIDGYFDHRLSVWHKEILWAISRGIPVYGAASMGALRAAELARFGMVGVGSIYDRFRRGELEDDDEVAVVHGPEERGYPSYSHALVNLRATLREALAHDLIDSGQEAGLTRTAKALNYGDRLFDRVVDESEGLSAALRGELKRWFARHGLVDQKRADATELLARVRSDLETGGATTVPIFRFETTNYWCLLKAKLDQAAARRGFGAAARDTARPAAAKHELAPGRPDASSEQRGRELLRALELHGPERHAEVWTRALERALALALGAGADVDASEVQTCSESYRRALGLLTPEATSSWLTANGLDLADFSALMRDEALNARFAPSARDHALRQVASVLRSLGLFAETVRQSEAGGRPRSD